MTIPPEPFKECEYWSVTSYVFNLVCSPYGSKCISSLKLKATYREQMTLRDLTMLTKWQLHGTLMLMRPWYVTAVRLDTLSNIMWVVCKMDSKKLNAWHQNATINWDFQDVRKCTAQNVMPAINTSIHLKPANDIKLQGLLSNMIFLQHNSSLPPQCSDNGWLNRKAEQENHTISSSIIWSRSQQCLYVWATKWSSVKGFIMGKNCEMGIAYMALKQTKYILHWQHTKANTLMWRNQFQGIRVTYLCPLRKSKTILQVLLNIFPVIFIMLQFSLILFTFYVHIWRMYLLGYCLMWTQVKA
jgi:hypothetical protein